MVKETVRTIEMVIRGRLVDSASFSPRGAGAQNERSRTESHARDHLDLLPARPELPVGVWTDSPSKIGDAT